MTGRTITYNGKTIATATRVERNGINYTVTYSSGYAVVLPASQMSADLLAMADA
jgi:hypothetical protein